MKLQLKNTMSGLVPINDASYDEKKKLKIGQVYEVTIKLVRNYEFHKKYFALINCAWEYLPEHKQEFFKTKEVFRKTIEVIAGHCIKWYSPILNEFVDIPESIAFDKMDNAAFQDLYSRVLDVILATIQVDREEFERNIINFL